MGGSREYREISFFWAPKIANLPNNKLTKFYPVSLGWQLPFSQLIFLWLAEFICRAFFVVCLWGNNISCFWKLGYFTSLRCIGFINRTRSSLPEPVLIICFFLTRMPAKSNKLNKHNPGAKNCKLTSLYAL